MLHITFPITTIMIIIIIIIIINWLKAFPANHRHITKNFNAIIDEPEKAPNWFTTGITYLILKSGDSKEVRNY